MEKVILDPTQDASVFRRAYDEGYKPDWDEVFKNYDAAVDVGLPSIVRIT